MRDLKFSFSVLFFSLIFFSCKENQVVNPSYTNNEGNILFKIDRQNAPDNVAIVTAKLTRSGFTTISQSLNIQSDTTADLTVQNVAVGTWHLKVEAFSNNNVLLYSGETDVVVQDGITTQVSLVLQPVATGVGNIYIFVTWGVSTSEWTDYINNPILKNSTNSTFEVGGLIHPTVLLENGVYKMWYAGVQPNARTTVHLAVSTNGKVWEKVQIAPVFSPSDSGWDSQSVQCGTVIKKENIYLMYYFGYSDQFSGWKIGLATSSDGLNWTRRAEPILEGDSIHGNQLTISAVVKWNNSYYMYYTVRNAPNPRIYLAKSNDGINWVKHSSSPILYPTFSWEGNSVYEPSVIHDDNQFKMVYMTASGYESKNFGYATSSDGINWTKRTQPTFSANKTRNGWGGFDIAYPYLLRDNTELKLYYCGIGTGSSTYRIGVAFK